MLRRAKWAVRAPRSWCLKLLTAIQSFYEKSIRVIPFSLFDEFWWIVIVFFEIFVCILSIIFITILSLSKGIYNSSILVGHLRLRRLVWYFHLTKVGPGQIRHSSAIWVQIRPGKIKFGKVHHNSLWYILFNA